MDEVSPSPYEWRQASRAGSTGGESSRHGGVRWQPPSRVPTAIDTIERVDGAFEHAGAFPGRGRVHGARGHPQRFQPPVIVHIDRFAHQSAAVRARCYCRRMWEALPPIAPSHRPS